MSDDVKGGLSSQSTYANSGHGTASGEEVEHASTELRYKSRWMPCGGHCIRSCGVIVAMGKVFRGLLRMSRRTSGVTVVGRQEPVALRSIIIGSGRHAVDVQRRSTMRDASHF